MAYPNVQACLLYKCTNVQHKALSLLVRVSTCLLNHLPTVRELQPVPVIMAMTATVKVLKAESGPMSIAETFSSLKATSAAKAEERSQENVQPISILPVDSGIVVDSHMVQRFVKGEDLAFQYRADPDLLGRSMLQAQPGDPNEWKLNYDVFVVCDGHSGIRVCSLALEANVCFGVANKCAMPFYQSDTLPRNTLSVWVVIRTLV